MAISISPFIRTAEKAGMPVKMLQFVERHYKIETGDENTTLADSNTIRLTQKVCDDIKSATIGKIEIGKNGRPFTAGSEFEAVAALYHEAAHAYADLKLGPWKPETVSGLAQKWPLAARGQSPPNAEFLLQSKRVQTVFTAAERYYDRAPFINPDPACKDPLHPRGTWQAVKNEDRVALEAVAMYVETRAGAFWRVVDDLTGWINKLDVNTLRAAKLALPKAVESIGAYQKAMADLIHGYDETPMFAGVLGGKQYEVDKPISAALKKFCDEDLLESKIPDKFHHSPRLEGLYAKIIDKVISIQARAPLSNPK